MPHSHKDIANLDMIGRMIRAAGRTVGQYDPDQIKRLANLQAELDSAMVEAIAGQRLQGIWWSSIAEELGVTKQAVIQRYGKAVAAAHRQQIRKAAAS